MPTGGRREGGRLSEWPKGDVLEGAKNTPPLGVPWLRLCQPFFLSISLQGDPAPPSPHG